MAWGVPEGWPFKIIYCNEMFTELFKNVEKILIIWVNLACGVGCGGWLLNVDVRGVAFSHGK